MCVCVCVFVVRGGEHSFKIGLLLVSNVGGLAFFLMLKKTQTKTMTLHKTK